jgi:hypothetical protein
MRRFRKTGSVTRFFVEGDAADASDVSLLKLLQDERFRPLGDSATEDEAAGWVARADASGTKFDPAEIVAPPFLAFTLRYDKKRVSPTLLRIQIDADLRGASRGSKPLPREQKKQIILEAKRKLVARALPSVSLVDCLWNCGDGVLLVFATGAATVDRVTRHFRETFRRNLLSASPSAVAKRAGLGDALARALREAAPADFSPASKSEVLGEVLEETA